MAAATLSVTACSLLLDWGDYTGVDAGKDGDTTSAGISCGADQRCAPVPPTGWSGPLALYEGPAGGVVPRCAAGSSSTPAFEGNGGMVAPAASCSACVCSAAQGGACSLPLLSFYSDANCATPCGSAVSLAVTTCAAPPACGASFDVGAPVPVPVAGPCRASGGTTTLPPVTWSRVARACTPATAPVRGSCGADQLCVPSPSPPFPPRLCIMQIGEAPVCPAGAYIGGPYVYHAPQVADTRACTPCVCGPSTGASCSFPPVPPPGFRYLDTACRAPTLPFSVPSGCQSLKGSNPLKLTSAASLTPGTCQPAGGDPVGTVTSTASMTFCCTP